MSVSNFKPTYKSDSPYAQTPISGPFMAYYVHRSIDPHPTDIAAVIDDERYVARPDLLSNDMYGNPDLWWVIGVRNGFEDPVFDLKIGTYLYLPSLEHLREIL